VATANEEALRAQIFAAQGGDGDAYAVLLRALDGHLRAYYRRRLGADPEAAEDLVQEALLAVHNQRHTYEPAEPFTPWVYAIAKYKLIDWLRRHERRAEESLGDDEGLLWQDSDVDAVGAARDVARLLARLPARFALPIRHVKLEGLSVAETAALTGMSDSAIKVGIHRGLKLLARVLREADHADA